MTAPATDILWIFLHLPKSGGTTFKAHLEKHFVQGVELIELSYWGRRYRREHSRPELSDRAEAERAQVKVIAGHDAYFGIHRLIPGDREVRYVSFMRDPADRCVSLYNFRRSRGFADASFEAWYEDYYRAGELDSAVRFFAERLSDERMGTAPVRQLELAKLLLARCWFVTTTDRLADGLNFLSAAMGLPADWRTLREAGSGVALPLASHPSQGERVERHHQLDDGWRARIYRDSPNDLALYRWVRANRWPLG